MPRNLHCNHYHIHSGIESIHHPIADSSAVASLQIPKLSNPLIIQATGAARYLCNIHMHAICHLFDSIMPKATTKPSFHASTGNRQL
jgi:hypothetical protein